MLTYDVDRYEVPIGANTSVRINGVDLRGMAIELESYPKELLMPPVRERQVVLDGRSGAIDFGSKYEPWAFTINCRIHGLNHTDMIAKLTEFLSWIDIEQHRHNEFFVKQEAPRELAFELAGHKYWYEEGSILAVNSSNVIHGGLQQLVSSTTTSTTSNKLNDTSGDFNNNDVQVGDVVWNTTDNTGTTITAVDSSTVLSLRDDIMVSGETYQIRRNPQWNTRVKAGVQFEIQGDSTKYFVKNVTKDGATLYLDSNVSRSTLVGATYKAERRRYLFVNFSGVSSADNITQGFFKEEGAAKILRLGLGFRALNPYWQGDINEVEFTNVSNGSFVELDGVGTAAFNPAIYLSDSVTSPDVTTGNHSFHLDFRQTNNNARGIKNDSDLSGTVVAITESYRASRHNYAWENAATGGLAYATDLAFRPRTFGFLLRYYAGYDSNEAGSDTTLFHIYDASDLTQLIELEYKRAGDLFDINIGDGTTINLTSDSVNFYTDDYIELAAWFNYDGIEDPKDGTTYYAKMFMNGMQILSKTTEFKSGSSLILPTGLDALVLGAHVTVHGSPPTISQSDISDFDSLDIFCASPTDEEIQKWFHNQVPLVNTNTTWNSTETLASGDILKMDAHRNQVHFYDDSELFLRSSEPNISGNPPIFRGNRNEKQTVYLDASGTITKISFVYRGHYR